MKDKLKVRSLIAQNIDNKKILPRWRKMMQYRFGLLDNKTHTLSETGKKFGGITRERVRQIEVRVLREINKLS